MPFERLRGSCLPALVAAALCAATSGCESVQGANWDGPRSLPPGAQYAPRIVAEQRVAGWVVLRCRLGQNQTATQCRTVAEAPEGGGFAEAALRVSQGVRVREASVPGERLPSLGQSFNLPVGFCPPFRSECQAQVNAQAMAFANRLALINRAVEQGDCASALRDASATGFGALVRMTRESCGGPSATP